MLGLEYATVSIHKHLMNFNNIFPQYEAKKSMIFTKAHLKAQNSTSLMQKNSNCCKQIDCLYTEYY